MVTLFGMTFWWPVSPRPVPTWAAWPWPALIPASLGVTGIGLSVFPGVRRPGVLAVSFATIFGTTGVHVSPLFGSSCFAVYAALLAASTAVFWPRVVRCMFLPFAFIEAAWLASVARRLLFELATVGHLSNRVDPCALMFTPLGIGLLLFAILAAACALANRPTLGATAPGFEKLLLFYSSPSRPSFTIAIAIGTSLGFATWGDWHIGHSCL